MKRSVLPVALVVAALSGPVAGGTAASREATRVPGSVVGCWHRNVTAADFKRAGTGGFPTGVWSMAIDPAGAFGAYAPGSKCSSSADFTTTVSVTGGRLTVNAVPVCASKGVYGWKVAGRLLTLRALADKSCSPRVGLFDGVWTRQ